MGRFSSTSGLRIPFFVFMTFAGSLLVVLHSSQNTTYKRKVQFKGSTYGVYDDSSISSDGVGSLLNKIGENKKSMLSENLMRRFQKLENGVRTMFGGYDKLDTLDGESNNLIQSSLYADQETQAVNKKTSISTRRNTLVSMASNLQTLTRKVDGILDELKYREQIPSPKKEVEKPQITSLLDIKACSADTNVLFMVTSHSSNNKRRQTIRNNWGNKDKFRQLKERFNLTYEVFFSVGLGDNYESNERIKQESKIYRDILIVNRHEDFYDLTRRVMTTFEWAANRCHFEHLFKMDDDIFINIPNVFTFLANATLNMTNLYAGDMNIEAPVNRDPKSKYSVSFDEWPAETYPPYCSGGGFIISRDIIKAIIPYFEWTNPYKIDDVYIGILIQRAKLENVEYFFPENDDMFWFYSKTTECDYKPASLVYHKVDNNECMRQLTLKSLQNLTLAIDTINFIKNKPPPSLEELSKKVFVPSKIKAKELEKSSGNEKGGGKKGSKIPSLDDLPKALSPHEAKKKMAAEYFFKLKHHILMVKKYKKEKESAKKKNNSKLQEASSKQKPFSPTTKIVSSS